MAQLNDPILGGTLGIEPTSRAARTIPVYADGAPIQPKRDGNFFTRLEIIPTTLTAATMYWAMRNNGSKDVRIKAIDLALMFSGTAAASRSAYELVRFSGANPTGGTSVAAVKGDNVDDANSVVTDIRFAPAGLTAAGISFETNAIAVIGHINQLTANIVHHLDFDEDLVLAPGEGLALRSQTAIIAGSAVNGCVKWSERA